MTNISRWLLSLVWPLLIHKQDKSVKVLNLIKVKPRVSEADISEFFGSGKGGFLDKEEEEEVGDAEPVTVAVLTVSTVVTAVER